MKKNKGFTLIELLAVLVILGILVTFSTIAIGKLKKKQDVKNLENTISSILTGAKAYNAESRIKTGVESDSGITIEDLKSSGFVDFDESVFKGISDINNIKVYKIACTTSSYKLYYKIEIDGDVYTDCGCELQPDDSTTSETICKE